jgi:hypothetical protein
MKKTPEPETVLIPASITKPELHIVGQTYGSANARPYGRFAKGEATLRTFVGNYDVANKKYVGNYVLEGGAPPDAPPVDFATLPGLGAAEKLEA